MILAPGWWSGGGVAPSPVAPLAPSRFLSGSLRWRRRCCPLPRQRVAPFLFSPTAVAPFLSTPTAVVVPFLPSPGRPSRPLLYRKVYQSPKLLVLAARQALPGVFSLSPGLLPGSLPGPQGRGLPVRRKVVRQAVRQAFSPSKIASWPKTRSLSTLRCPCFELWRSRSGQSAVFPRLLEVSTMSSRGSTRFKAPSPWGGAGPWPGGRGRFLGGRRRVPGLDARDRGTLLGRTGGPGRGPGREGPGRGACGARGNGKTGAGPRGSGDPRPAQGMGRREKAEQTGTRDADRTGELNPADATGKPSKNPQV
jgi:hypothetical protein